MLNDFLAMGGYGFYVWGAYGVTALVLAVEVASLRARRRRAFAQAHSGEPDAPSQATFSEYTR